MRASKIAMMIAAISWSTSAMAEWNFRVLTDPMTDAERGIASVEGSGGLLVVKCDEPGQGSLYVDILSENYLGSGYRGYRRDLEFRFDDDPADKILAHYSVRSALLIETDPGTGAANFWQGWLTAPGLL